MGADTLLFHQQLSQIAQVLLSKRLTHEAVLRSAMLVEEDRGKFFGGNSSFPGKGGGGVFEIVRRHDRGLL